MPPTVDSSEEIGQRLTRQPACIISRLPAALGELKFLHAFYVYLIMYIKEKPVISVEYVDTENMHNLPISDVLDIDY